MTLPFDNFECDKCGACCESLIVEAYDYDARREPKLYEISNIPRESLREQERCIILYDRQTRACPFLCGETKHCQIYDTRPVACVMVEPGDAKCQQARLKKNLPLLQDKNGKEPTADMLLESCYEYQLDPSEVGLCLDK